MNKNICVFCSSSNNVDKIYFQAAAELGQRIGQENDNLIYGAGNVGLMGELAHSAHQNGARITGIIPQLIHDFGVGWQEADEYIITKDMRERKKILSEKADVFIALPGGFGTLEEVMEVMTLKQLGYQDKPIIFLNTNDFYKGLMAYFESLFESSFAKQSSRNLYYVAANVEEIYHYLSDYTAEELEQKWY